MLTPSIQSNHTQATEHTDAMDGGSTEVAADKKPSRSSPPKPDGPLANLLRREPHLVQAIASHLDPRSVRSFAQVSNLTRPYLQVELGAAAIESRAPHLRPEELGQARTATQQLPPNFRAGPNNAITHRVDALTIELSAPHMTHPAQITNAYLDARALPAEFQEGPVNAITQQISELRARELDEQMQSFNAHMAASIRDAAQEQ
jgi:hypothetical protein